MAQGIHFAVGAARFGELEESDLALTALLGFLGIEGYRSLSMRWVERPQALKALLDRHGITLITCSNGGAATRPTSSTRRRVSRRSTITSPSAATSCAPKAPPSPASVGETISRFRDDPEGIADALNADGSA